MKTLEVLGGDNPTEAEMRDTKVPTHERIDDLAAYIRSLVDRPHDYGTCVYAMSMAATAAFKFVAAKLRVTGFQASCADMDILSRTRGWKWGMILDYENLLYPQYCTPEHFPDAETSIRQNAKKLGEMAKQKLAENPGAHQNVLDHWNFLVDVSMGEVEPKK